MAPSESKNFTRKKPGSKWRRRVDISGLGSREKGQGFAQVRRAKAIQEYKKLLRKTRKEHQTSSYVQNVYSTEENQNSKAQQRLQSTNQEVKKLPVAKDIHVGVVERDIETPLEVVDKPKIMVQDKAMKYTKSNKTLRQNKTNNKSSQLSTNRQQSPQENRKRKQNKSRFTDAQKEYKRKKVDIAQSQKERQEQKEKRIKELQQSVERRRQTYHQLSKRTRRGQPVMSNQINHILSKLQSNS